jgi:hypothetical protein
MLRSIGWLVLLGCVACGETAKPHADEQGGATATSGGATAGSGGIGGSGGNDVGGNNAGGSTSGGAGGSSGGGAGVGGGRTAPCGGDVTGNWFAVEPAAAKNRPASVDDCFNLSLQRGSAGDLETKRGIWVDYRATPRTTDWRFRAPETPDADATFVFSLVNRGEVIQDYADACLADGQGKATCSELSELLTTIGLGEGSYPNVTCVNGAAGGCSCTFKVVAVGGSVGNWSPSTNDSKRLTISRPQPLNPGQFDSYEVPYCVQGDRLGFGSELDEIYTATLPLDFERVSCRDGVQGPTEGGPDCDGACPKSCP